MKFRVRYAETDQMGIAHHSAYVIWLEMGRVDWLKAQGMDYRQMEESGLFLAVSRLDIRYQASARFDDLLELRTQLTEAKSRQVQFSYTLTRPADRASIASGLSVHTPINKVGKPVRIPALWLDPLSTLVSG